MSFQKLKDAELREVAELFGVDLSDCVNSKNKIDPTLAAAAFNEDGVTWDMYAEMLAKREEARLAAAAEEELERQRLANVIKEEKVMEPEVEPVEDEVIVTRRRTPREKDVLVKMDRQNPHFEVAGKTFTKDHPFVICTEDEAQAIFDLEHGFHIATPREAAEYYS